MRHAAVLPLLIGACASAAEPVDLLLFAPDEASTPSTVCALPLCTSLRSRIERAEHTIDFAVYGVRGMPEIVDALRDARARGVVVRGVVDRNLDGTNEYAGTEALIAALDDVTDDLAADRRASEHRRPFAAGGASCGVDALPGLRGPRSCYGFDLGDRCVLGVAASREPLAFDGDILHDKFFVVDHRWVWTGSTNVSDSCAGGYNANLVVLLDSAEVAAWYTREFEQLHGGVAHGEKPPSGTLRTRLDDGTDVEVLFSPQDHAMTRALRPLLQRARSRIDVAAFFLTHAGVASDLVAAARRGVQVRVLLDATGASNAYSKHVALRLAGVPVKVEPWGGKMHAKAVAIDGAWVVAGSMNFTSAGDGSNDENTLVLGSTALAARFHAWFDATWARIPDRWLTADPDPESTDSGRACVDHVDNDHDGRVDRDDPGCGPRPPPLLPENRVVVVPKAADQPLVRAFTDAAGHRLYRLPGQEGWDAAPADTLFCSKEDAEAAGFRKAR